MIKKMMMLCVAVFAVMGAWAETETVNGIEWTYMVTDGKASIGSGSWGSSAIPAATTGAITIPSTLGGYPVTRIGSCAFYSCSSLTSVTIPDGIEIINGDAFYGCEALAEVSLPDGLTGSEWYMDINSVFSDTPFIVSDTFPKFILSRSGKTLYGIKTKKFDSLKDWDDVWDEMDNVEILVPSTVEYVGDFALWGAISVSVYHPAWGDYDENHIDVAARIIFTGSKPSASELAFTDLWDYGYNGIVNKVYYYQGEDGWTFGENWCGVKTYALDRAPDEFAVDSGLTFGKVYGGGMWDGSGYSEREIWEESTVESGLLWPGEKGGEYAFIPVLGEGSITPIIYGDKKYVTKVEVWTDGQMFEKFTPKGVSSSKWEDDADYWEYESGIKWYSWPKSVWPDNKVVSGRRWIVVGISQNTMSWAGRAIFRVGVVGSSELSESVVVKISCDNLNPPMSDFFHGMSISGIQHFNCIDTVQRAGPMYERPDGTIGVRNIYAPTFEFFRLDDKALIFNIEVPSAGTLVVSSEDDDDDSPALREVFSVTGNNILTDVFTEKWEWDNLEAEDTNFWKTSCAPWIRRIEVSAKTTLKFTRRNTDDCDCEFNRMYFFPKNKKSVAIGVDYVSVYDPDGDWWDHGYLQGYVKGMGVYKSGETATLTAVPGEGERFDHWEVCFGNLELTESQRKSATLSFKVTDAMCGNMEDEEQIYIQAVWKPKYSILALPSIAGAGTVTGSGSYYEGDTVTLKATAAKGCSFVKWSDGETSPTRTITVVPAYVERVIFACFEAPNGVPNGNGGENSGGDAFLVIPDAASVYDGYVMNGDVVVGTMQAKVAKPKKGEAKVTVTVQIAGEKKLSIKGQMNAAAGAFTGETKDGRVLSLTFNMDEIKGAFGNYEIGGTRNFFTSKDKAEVKASDELLAPWIGAMNMIIGDGTLSVTIAKKGKVTVKGTIDGEKISAKAQTLIGEDMICIPVIYSKKTVKLAFTIWLPLDGGEAEVVGLDGAIIGKAGTLKTEAKFYIDDAILSDIEGIVTYNGKPALPDGESVSQSKTKWVVANGVKAAKVAYKKGVLSITEGKKGAGIANISGLKLTYKSKDGSFKGSFTVYAIENGKLKKHKATVEGILIGDVGYGTITIKKVGTWAVTIE